MSNRIAASRMSDRLELVAWMPRSSRWSDLVASAQGWLVRPVGDERMLSARLRRDVGLATVPETTGVRDFEARRLGF
jgi:hypothetical protein